MSNRPDPDQPATPEQREEMESRAQRLNGILTGMCQPEEYEDLLAADLLYRSYEGTLGLMGLSTLRMRNA